MDLKCMCTSILDTALTWNVFRSKIIGLTDGQGEEVMGNNQVRIIFYDGMNAELKEEKRFFIFCDLDNLETLFLESQYFHFYLILYRFIKSSKKILNSLSRLS